ncbi:MAG: UDP-N-acetylmuramoyl-tripeptide--D-alanyl-D-alanine ligase [Candidatus Flexifilum sp.]
MSNAVLSSIIGLIWLAGTWYRAYRLARYYQIEEYMSLRFGRWMLQQRRRWLPWRPVLSWGIGAALLFVLTEAPGTFMFGVIGVVGALIAVWPATEGEIKKQFRATPRARRLLVTAFALQTLIMVAGWIAINTWERGSALAELVFIGISLLGLTLLLTAPVVLIAANFLMFPVESVLRTRFIHRARRVLNEVNPIVIGITGSYGKTSTKTYLAHILNGRFRAYPTPKSYNTMMGVCIAINNDIAADHSIEYFICEMGAYIPGEIARICDLTHPSISVVVEVGPQHLERFGSLENIAIAKYEIIKALPEDGLGVFNWDNPYVREMYERGYPRNRIAVSRTIDPAAVPPGGPRFVASNVEESLDGLRFDVTDVAAGETARFETPLLGLHNVTNILLAAAIAVHEGMPLRDVARRVRSLQPAESRLVRQTTPEGITIINDAYSANPVGVVHALRVLSLHQTGRRLLITPGMVELGPMMESENRKLGETAAQHATDVILIGAQQTDPIRAGLLDAGFDPDRIHVMATLSEAVAWYQRNLQPGDCVLFMNDLPDTYSS